MNPVSKEAFELVLKLLAAAIAVFGVVRFFADRALERELTARGRALAAIERYGDSELREDRQNLFDFWVARPEVVAHLRGNTISPRAYATFLVTAFDADPASRELYGAIYALTGFFDQTYFCLDSGVCDEAMLRAYFCEIAPTLDRLYAPVLGAVRQRSGFDAFGAGLTKMAGACG